MTTAWAFPPVTVWRMRATWLLASLAWRQFALVSSVRITSPTSGSSFHASDEAVVRWFYEGTGQYFKILLHKSGELVADLCEAEKDGLCFDLTGDQTVVLPSTGVTSDSDYTITVQETSSEQEDISDPFTIIEDPHSNIEITYPDGLTSFRPGDDLEVKWLYVGNNDLFDIYVRQGDGYNSRRVSDNLCGSESDGSCRGSSVGQAVVTLPKELEAADNYVLLVVDREDDDAHGISTPLSVGLSVTSAGGGSGMGLGLDNVAAEVAVLAAIFVAAFSVMAGMVLWVRRRKAGKLREDKVAALGSSHQRRPAPTVHLAVEDMQQPVSPTESEDVAKNFINPIYSTSQNFYEGQITPPTEDSTIWRKSRDMGRYMGRQISQSLSRSLTNMEE